MQIDNKIADGNLHILKGDLTEMDVDAIVNAANAQLILGGGVAGAIRSKGGPAIQEECNKIGGTFTGGSVITTAGNLKARHVIHAAGPVMGEGDEDEKLGNAVVNSLKRAEENDLESIAFPAISTGIFGFPMGRCAEIMLAECVSYLEKKGSVENIYFCLWDQSAFDVFAGKLKKLHLSYKCT